MVSDNESELDLRLEKSLIAGHDAKLIDKLGII